MTAQRNGLFRHQEDAVRFATDHNFCCAIFHEMGLGKTRTAIEILRKLREIKPMKMLVIAPLSLLNSAWAWDIKRFSEFSFQNLRDEWLISERPDIYLINYEGLLRKDKVDDISKFAAHYPILCVADESSRMKNFRSKTSKILLQFRDKFPHRIVMSGTPGPNSELEYWAQMEFVRPGILHPSFYAFRNTFFHLENVYTRRIRQGQFMTRSESAEMFRKGWRYAITAANREKLIDRITPFCHSARKADCLDLPPETDEDRIVEMSQEQSRAYDEMKIHLVTEIKGTEIAAQVALTKIMKLRQITSGFIYDEAGSAHEFVGNPKINELVNVIDEAGPQPIIIWSQFHWETVKICHELYEKFGENQVVTLYGETKDKDGSIAAFRDGRARFLVANPHSAAHGLTFVNCSLQIFFSLDYSWEGYEQARARIHRAGQTKPCTYVHILAAGTIDEDILKILRKKGDAQELVYNLTRR